MTRTWRFILLFAGLIGLSFLFAFGSEPLRHPRDIRNRYAQQINSRAFAERNITDAVTAVNFDYRGFDTIGEEFILFVSVLGAIVLLRITEERKEKLLRDAVEPYRELGASDATRLWVLVMVAPKITFGIYVVTHGHL